MDVVINDVLVLVTHLFDLLLPFAISLSLNLDILNLGLHIGSIILNNLEGLLIRCSHDVSTQSASRISFKALDFVQ